MLFLKIDFEKAYDKIEWSFILVMLSMLGFDPHFLQTIRMLFFNASIVLSMNNIQSPSIGLFHYVR